MALCRLAFCKAFLFSFQELAYKEIHFFKSLGRKLLLLQDWNAIFFSFSFFLPQKAKLVLKYFFRDIASNKVLPSLRSCFGLWCTKQLYCQKNIEKRCGACSSKFKQGMSRDVPLEYPLFRDLSGLGFFSASWRSYMTGCFQWSSPHCRISDSNAAP